MIVSFVIGAWQWRWGGRGFARQYLVGRRRAETIHRWIRNDFNGALRWQRSATHLPQQHQRLRGTSNFEVRFFTNNCWFTWSLVATFPWLQVLNIQWILDSRSSKQILVVETHQHCRSTGFLVLSVCRKTRWGLVVLEGFVCRRDTLRFSERLNLDSRNSSLSEHRKFLRNHFLVSSWERHWGFRFVVRYNMWNESHTAFCAVFLVFFVCSP